MHTLQGGGLVALALRGRLLARLPRARARICGACTRASARRARHGAAAAAAEPAASFLVLERAVAVRADVDRELWHAGRFNAEVYPDLPVAGSWANLLSSLLSRRGGGQGEAGAQQERLEQRLLVRTVACQVRRRAHLRRRLLQAAGEGADAVLCLSGSHPAHRLAAAAGWSPDSFELLRTAAALKQQGALPARLALWAVENPLRNPAGRLEQKLEAGASVVLTQPPLLWDRFSAWWADVHRRGLTQQARVVVGVPMLTSAGNARFWLQLCGAAGLPGAAQLVADFQQRQGDKAALAAFTAAYNKAMIDRALGLPGVGGLHIMPLTRPARAQVLALQQAGTIPQPL